VSIKDRFFNNVTDVELSHSDLASVDETLTNASHIGDSALNIDKQL